MGFNSGFKGLKFVNDIDQRATGQNIFSMT